MSSMTEVQETVRVAVLTAIQFYRPSFKDAHVSWSGQPARFGSNGGSIQLDLISCREEANYSEHPNQGEEVRAAVYRMQVQVSVSQAGFSDAADIAMQLHNGLKNHAVKDALAPDVKVLGSLTRLMPHRVNTDGRAETHWSFEVPLRAQVSYQGTESYDTIGQIDLEMTATPDFEAVPVTVTEE